MAMAFKHYSVIFIFYLIVIILSTTCKSNKKITLAPAKIRTQQEVVASIQRRNIDFNFLAIRGTADFEALGMGGSGTLQLRIKKDSLIWIQGKKLGIEGFRGVINVDSFTMVNRLDRSYYYEPNDAISSIFGVEFTFDEIQQLMAGNILPFTENDVTHYQQMDNLCTMILNNAAYNITLTIDAYTLQLKEYALKDRNGNTALAKFDDYKSTNKTKVLTPFSRNYYFKSRDGDQGKIEINISELELNIEKSLIFNLPLHYDRLRL
jgi:hypothetical protein